MDRWIVDVVNLNDIADIVANNFLVNLCWSTEEVEKWSQYNTMCRRSVGQLYEMLAQRCSNVSFCPLPWNEQQKPTVQQVQRDDNWVGLVGIEPDFWPDLDHWRASAQVSNAPKIINISQLFKKSSIKQDLET